MPCTPRLLSAPILLASLVSASLQADPASAPQRGDVSGNATTIATADSDIRPTWTPDGRSRLWGTIDAMGRHEIVEQVRVGRGWGAVQRSSLNAGGALDAIKDFDPVVLRDGSAVVFFSDRAGGLGGTDLWIAARDHDGWGRARPLPAPLNSGADEWSPAISPDGRYLLFSSDRAHPGAPHRLYLARRDRHGGWRKPVPVEGVDADRFAFDPCWIGGHDVIAYSRSVDPGQGSELVTARLRRKTARLDEVQALPAPFNNASGWAFGCAWNPRDAARLHVSTVLGERPQRLDIHALALPAGLGEGR